MVAMRNRTGWECREKRRQRSARWRAANLDRAHANNAAWYERNRARKLAYMAARHAADPLKDNMRQQLAYRRKRLAVLREALSKGGPGGTLPDEVA